jgi:hypothetical protein
MISGAILFFPSLYFLSNDMDSRGLLLNQNHFSLFIGVGAHIVVVLRLLFKSYRYYLMLILVISDVLLFCIVLIYQAYSPGYTSIYEACVIQMIESSHYVIGLIATIAIIFLFNWTVWEFVYMPTIFPCYKWIKEVLELNEQLETPQSLNDKLLSQSKTHQEIPQMVLRCFGIAGGSPILIRNRPCD